MGDSQAERLWLALDILRSRGWTKRSLVASDGKVCMMGALHLAHGQMVGRFSATDLTTSDARLLRETVKELFPHLDDVRSVAQFNDDRATKQEMVEQTFHKAALKAEERI